MHEPGNQDIEKCIDFLEDHSLTTYQSRCENYQKVQSKLSGNFEIDESVARRLLKLCIHDLQKDVQFTAIILPVISRVLKKIEEKKCPVVLELVSSAVAVLHTIMTTGQITKVPTLQKLGFETFLCYPDETYIALASNHCSAVTELCSSYLHQGIPAHLQITAFQTIHAILKSLPPEKKRDFVNNGLDVWFSNVIPSIMSLVVTDQNADVSVALEVMEILVAELEHIEYSDNTEWKQVMDCIYAQQKYPAVMKKMLESGDDRWHILWIMFVKLLKQEITKSRPKLGSPINYMLPVVEAAFKLDITNRYYAFKCWRVLVDNFSEETNEQVVNKRIKLLIIPLKANNAKVQETALAKFDTWWHFIGKYEPWIQNHIDTIFIPFLQFCFGNPKHNGDTNVLVPGQLSSQLKYLSLLALVESVGHIDCTGCVPEEFPKLKKRVLNPRVLQDSLPLWILALKTVINNCGEAAFNLEENRKWMYCIWKSFLSVSSRLPENAKKDVVANLLTMATSLVEKVPNNYQTLDILFDIILKSFLEDPHMKNMLDRVTDADTALSGLTLQIMDLIISPTLINYYNSMEAKSAASKMRPFTSAVLNDALGPARISLELLLNELPKNDCGLLLWMALTKPVRKIHGELTPDVLKKVILWPLDNVGHFTKLKLQHAALSWNKTYNMLKSKVQNTTMQQDMVASLNKNKTACDLKLFALLHVMKNGYDREYKQTFKLDLPTLVPVLAKQNFDDCDNKEEIFRLAVDTSAMMLSRVGEVMDNTLTELASNLAKRSFEIFVQNENIHGNDGCVTCTEKLLVQLKRLTKIIARTELGSFIPIEQLLTSYTIIKLESAKNLIKEILNFFLCNSAEKGSPLIRKIKECIMTLKTIETPNQMVQFIAPDIFAKKKKKEATILNTVVENGEEYVVVKSNWKFNPRKLTENQKERLQRKREDIPALYQDLSQSQEEFKLQPWKADPQDTSASSSNTTTSASKTDFKDAVITLQKMPSTEVVSKIIENNFSDQLNSDSIGNDTKKLATNENCTTQSPKPGKILSLGPIKPKSPRVALKDRIFQNVRILMKNSSVPSEATSEPKDLNQTINVFGPKTPVSKTTQEPATVSSAPPKISVERPTRIKRKPTKLTDFTELSLKRKRRLSLMVKNSQNYQGSSEAMSDSQNNTVMVSDDEIAGTQSAKLDNDMGSTNVVETSKKVEETKQNDGLKETVDPQKVEEPKNPKEIKPDCIVESKSKVKTLKTAEDTKQSNPHNEIVAPKNEEEPSKPKELKPDSVIDSTNKSKVLPEKRKPVIVIELKSKVEQLSEIQEKKQSNIRNEIQDDTGNESEDIHRCLNTEKVEEKVATNPETTTNAPEAPFSHYEEEPISQDIDVTSVTSAGKSKDDAKYTAKKPKKSSIEKKLAIDMVEGHPLFRDQPEKRLRKSAIKAKLVPDLNMSSPEITIDTQGTSFSQDDEPFSQDIEDTPVTSCKKSKDSVKGMAKKPKKSNIEKKLAIDMVERHPLFREQPEKRLSKSPTGLISPVIVIEDSNDDESKNFILKSNSETVKAKVVKDDLKRTSPDQETSFSQDEEEPLSQATSGEKSKESAKDTAKKSRKSRIEKTLAIDMVEGHPLFKDQLEKRLRKAAGMTTVNSMGIKDRQEKESKNNKKKSNSETIGAKVVNGVIKTTSPEPAIDSSDTSLSNEESMSPDNEGTSVSSGDNSKESAKDTAKKQIKSRIEKTLAIDMVEGHPLFKDKLGKRLRNLPAGMTTTNSFVNKDSNDRELKNYNKISNSETVKTKVVKPDLKRTSAETAVIARETSFSQDEEEPLGQDIEATSVICGGKSKDSAKDMAKKSRKSRIGKKLVMSVEESRTNITNCATGVISTRRKAGEKINQEAQSDSKLDVKPKRKLSESPKDHNKEVKNLFSIRNSQEKNSMSSNELPETMSEDFIESSQDSTFTTISVISSKKTPKVVLENIQSLVKSIKYSPETQNVVRTNTNSLMLSPENDDIEISRNKTVEPDSTNNTVQDLTADCDTEPMDNSKFRSTDLIMISDEPEPVIMRNEDTYIASTQTQDTANADTQPNDSKYLSEMEKRAQLLQGMQITDNSEEDQCQDVPNFSQMNTPEVVELPTSTTDAVIVDENETGMSSPFKDEGRRNKDFLNHTLEISPIKSLSPIPDNKMPNTPETSSDYLVVKLSSPVQCNGEPFEKSASPEIFTDDKVLPDKRDVSPPRAEVSVATSSPSLSLKKNKPQMRQGGRAAQMLGLCVPDMHYVMNADPVKSIDPDEAKKTAPSTPKRNLSMLYNCDQHDINATESENSENFLKFKKTLPTADCSPAVPILKRKLIDIADDATVSPASKRKRVSFHDPPVSTTISIHKYIDPLGIRSPQSSLTKKQDRQQRSANMKSPKKLENIFKLDTALTRTVESFDDPNTSNQSEDITINSLDPTPSLEIIKAGELNDADPICPELVHCTDAINLIAEELSSPTMKTLFIKELEENIQTIGDLAKMTELEVNRLCIRAPKVQIAKKVLREYAAKQQKQSEIVEEQINMEITEVPSELEIVVHQVDMEVQTDEASLIETEIQTDVVSLATIQTQTEAVKSRNFMVQTNESGSKSTLDIISECMIQKPDFVDALADLLDDASKRKIIDSLPLTSINDVLRNKLTDTASSSMIMDSLLKREEVVDKRERKSFLQKYLLQRYETKDLVLLCSQLLSKIHDKSL